MCVCQGNCNNQCKRPAWDTPPKVFVVGDVWEDTFDKKWVILSINGEGPRCVVAQRPGDRVLMSYYPDGKQYLEHAYGLVRKVTKKITIERWIAVFDAEGDTKTFKTPGTAKMWPPYGKRQKFAIKHVTFEVEEGEGL